MCRAHSPSTLLVCCWCSGYTAGPAGDAGRSGCSPTPCRAALVQRGGYRAARDHRIGISTSYRYLHEAITVLAAEAPELPEVLRERLAAGDTHVILDGTVIRSDRVAVTTENEKGKTINLWYSGKHKAFGGNVQFGVDRRRMSFVVLRCVPPAAAMTWQQLANMVRSGRCAPQPRKGYRAWRTTATASRGIGIHAPITNPPGDQVLDVNNRCYTSLHTQLRCLGERAAAILLTRRADHAMPIADRRHHQSCARTHPIRTPTAI
jgi:hypothetical protein